MAKEISDRTAAHCVWRRGTHRRCVTDPTSIVDVTHALKRDYRATFPRVVSQVQILLRGGGVILSTEFMTADRRGNA